MEFFNSIQQIKTNWQPYKKWEAEQEDKEFQRQELYKKVPASKEDLEKASQYGRTLIDSINIMDQYSINKAEDVELATDAGLEFVGLGVGVAGLALGAVALKSPKVNKITNELSNKIRDKYPLFPADGMIIKSFILEAGFILLSLITMPYFMVKAKFYQKEASRVARYQAREDELKDPKYFVIYDDEQIKEAKEIAKTMPDIVEKKKSKINPISNWNESIKSIKSILSSHKYYENWKQEHLSAQKQKFETLQSMNVSPEQLKNAKMDQDNLQRIIKKIETYSQNYLNNTEMATNVIAGSSLLTGYLGGKLVSLGVGLFQKLKIISPTSIFANNARKYSGGIGSLGMVMLAGTYVIKIQKEAAKIGRFKAKQELLKDPHNFITYSDEQLDSVKNLKAPRKTKKNPICKSYDSLKFFFQAIKDYKDYEKYQKTTGKEEQKLDKALLKINVSEKQLQDAKSLQKNAFMAFEKMDEMAQRYTDDMEAATDIGKQYIGQFTGVISGFYLIKNMLKQLEQAEKTHSDFVVMKAIKKSWIPFALTGLIEIITEIQSNQLKKRAGRIGVMEAIQDLENPKLFVNNESF